MMLSRNPIRLPRKVCLLCWLLLVPAISPAPVFIKLGDIKGESTDSRHEGWTEILSVQHGVESADGLPTGKRQHKPLVVTKPVDKASPLLMEALATGTPVRDIILESDQPAGRTGERIAYYQVRIDEALVTDYSVVAPDDAAEDLPVDSISLNFSYAEWHVKQIGLDGRVIDSASTYFDAELNESGELPPTPWIQQVGNQEAGTGDSITVDLVIEDFDTPLESLLVGADTSSLVNTNPPKVEWTGETWAVTIETTPIAWGQTTITVTAEDGENASSMSFSLFVDSTNDPFDGFLKAYFTEEELQDPQISSPIANPDGDQIATLLEFLLGTNPREFTPTWVAIAMMPGDAGDPDEAGRVKVQFIRRTDEPRIQLVLFGSSDGSDWTRMSDNPIYSESTTTGENPLYEGVSGTVTPPPGADDTYFLRFVAEMN